MSHKDEPHFLARPLAKQPRIRVGGREVGIVLAPLVAKIALAIAPRAGRIARASSGRKLFMLA
jgi:hypothetical protein